MAIWWSGPGVKPQISRRINEVLDCQETEGNRKQSQKIAKEQKEGIQSERETEMKQAIEEARKKRGGGEEALNVDQTFSPWQVEVKLRHGGSLLAGPGQDH